MDCQGAQSQKEGQENLGEIKELGGGPPAVSRSPAPTGLLLALGFLAIHQAMPIHQAILILAQGPGVGAQSPTISKS